MGKYSKEIFSSAVDNGHLELLKYVEAEFNVMHVYDDLDRTFLLWSAAYEGHHRIVSFLVSLVSLEEFDEFDINELCVEENALLAAVKKGHRKTIKVLLATPDVDASVSGHNGWSALHYAAVYGCSDITAILLGRSDVDVNAVDNERKTAIHYAAQKGEVETVKVLLAREARMTCDVHDMTPLHYAVEGEHCDVFRVLYSEWSDFVDRCDERLEGWIPYEHDSWIS